MNSYEVFTKSYSKIIQATSIESAIVTFYAVMAFENKGSDFGIICIIDCGCIVELLRSERFKDYKNLSI